MAVMTKMAFTSYQREIFLTSRGTILTKKVMTRTVVSTMMIMVSMSRPQMMKNLRTITMNSAVLMMRRRRKIPRKMRILMRRYTPILRMAIKSRLTMIMV
jgi:hypothetical protein